MEFAQTDDTVQRAVDAAFAGGGIIGVSPGRFGIAAVSPPLDSAGNSVRAQRAITAISNALGGNPFGSTTPQTEMVWVPARLRPASGEPRSQCAHPGS